MSIYDTLTPPAELPPLDHRWRHTSAGGLVWRSDPDDLTCPGMGVPPGPTQERTAQELDWWRAYHDEHPPTRRLRDERDQVALRMEMTDGDHQ